MAASDATENYEIVVENTYHGETLRYIIPKMNSIPAPGELSATSVRLDRPKNNKNFSLGGKGEGGSMDFTAIEIWDPDASNADRSAGTLDTLITTLENGTASQQEEATLLKAEFGQDSNGNYIVRTIEEQRRWLRDYVHNPGLSATWTLFGPTYSYRTTGGSVDPTIIDPDNSGADPSGTPIFLEKADVEPNDTNPARGQGAARFKLGGRL